MWKTDVVSAVFMVEEARRIYNIVISPSSQRDKLVWSGNKNGDYTVRRGYHFAKEGVDRNEGSTSNSSNMSHLWQTLWNFKGPGALRMFLWRACNNILPAKDNLYKRKIIDDPNCAICGGGPKTLGHVLWSCPAAYDVWLENMKSIQKRSSEEIDFRQLFELLYDRLEDEEFQRFVFVGRQLCFRRNKAIFYDKFLPPIRVNQIATNQLENYKKAKLEQRSNSGASTSTGLP